MEYIIIALSIISFLLLLFLIIYKKKNKKYINEIDILEKEKQEYINNNLNEIDSIFKEREENLQEEYREKKEKLNQEYKDYQEGLRTQLEYSKSATQAAKDSIQRELAGYKESQEQYMKDYLGNLYDSRKKEIDDIIKTQGQAEITCHFCNKKYTLSRNELENLIK